MAIQSSPGPRRSSRRIAIPTIIVLLLAVGWSAFWWFAAAKAEEQVALALAKEAERGRVLTCGQRSIGGYPFRLELVCEDAKFEMAGSHPYTVTSPRFLAAVQLYWPSLIIAEAQSPVQIDWMDEEPKAARLTFASAAASIGLGKGWQPDRFSLDMKDLTATTGLATQLRPHIGKAHLELHGREIECAGEAGCYQFAATIDAEETPALDEFLKRGHGLSADLQGNLSRGDVLREPGPLAERAQAWQRGGGKAQVTLLRAERSGVAVTASGPLALDPEGYLSGKLTMSVAGAEELGKTLKESGLAPEKFAFMLKTGLSLLGQTGDIAGKPAIKLPITFAEGHMQLGPFSMGKAPRLFKPSE